MISLRTIILPALLLACIGVAAQTTQTSSGRVSAEGPYKSKVRLLDANRPATDANADELLQNKSQNAYGRALVLRQLAQRGIAAGDSATAIDNFEQALALDSLSDLAKAQMQLNLGQLYALSGRHTEAVRLLEAAMKDFSQPDPALRMSLASSYLQTGQPGRAAEQASIAIQTFAAETPVEWIDFMVYAYWQSDNPAQAARWQLRRLNSSPDDGAQWTQLAALYRAAGDPARALATLQSAALSGLLVSSEEWLRLIQMHVEFGTPDIAAQWLQKQSDLKSNPQQLRWLSQLFLRSGDDAAALDAFEKWATVEQSAAAWLEFGELASSMAQREIAIGALRKAARPDAENEVRGKALLLLGQIEMERGNIRAARRAFTTATQYGGVYRAATEWLDYLAQFAVTADNDLASEQDNAPQEAEASPLQLEKIDLQTKTVSSLRVYTTSRDVLATNLAAEAIAMVGKLLRTSRRERLEWMGPLHLVVKGNIADLSGQLELSVAAPIRRVTPSRGEFASGELGTFRCAWQRYQGPRDGLQAAWQTLYAQTLAAGLQPSQEARQIILHRGTDDSDSIVELQIGIL